MSWDQLREEDGTNGFIHGLNSLSLSSLEYSEPLNAACMVSFFLFLAVYNFFFCKFHKHTAESISGFA